MTRALSPVMPIAIAAIRDPAEVRTHAYFDWSEGDPVYHLFRYLLLGSGDNAPVVREILWEVDADPHGGPIIMSVGDGCSTSG